MWYAFVIAFLGGFLPSIVWLIFWNEEKSNREPKKMVFLAFVGGIAAVFLSLLFEKIIFSVDPNVIFSGHMLQGVLGWFKHIAESKNISLNELLLVSVFAPFIEEILKFIMAFILVLRSQDDDEPIDPSIYMITTALGFAAVENVLFLMQAQVNPAVSNHFVTTLLTGDNRFIGAMLLHTVSSATIGLFIGFNLFDTKINKFFWTLLGILCAIVIHGTFNFFMSTSGQGYLVVFEVIWIAVIIILFILEKIKRIRLEKI